MLLLGRLQAPVGVSIRSPHRSEGRLVPSAALPLLNLSFNPLPSPKRGEICSSCTTWSESRFQSAPLTEARGDAFRRVAEERLQKFQSAPLTEARGDPLHHKLSRAGAKFQSAPLTEARGDRALSIGQIRDTMFQSAPLTEARGDTDLYEWPHVLRGFNPLPSPKRGEIPRV